LAGIYIHIPFCKKACHYCNFHFSTSLSSKEPFIDAICKEIELRHREFDDQKIETLYFGGGTPSILTNQDLAKIMNKLRSHFDFSNLKEFTFECNPDDICTDYLKILLDQQVDRLSIGIQTFQDKALIHMNRAHNSNQAKHALELSLKQGFQKLSADLIYGFPGSSNQSLIDDIQTLIDFEIKHVSSYALTIEEKTAYHKWVQSGKMAAVDEGHSSTLYDTLMTMLNQHDFLHYEISNFAKEGHLAVHNTNYWKSIYYIGFGPSAHSFYHHKRLWNVADNLKYVKAVDRGVLAMESETLTVHDQYNEYILTNLRTMWGISLAEILEHFGEEMKDHTQQILHSLDRNKIHEIKFDTFALTQAGKHFADGIASDFFIIQ
jgi:oxygen-independent coproporphyrinogen-3 oxidase